MIVLCKWPSVISLSALFLFKYNYFNHVYFVHFHARSRPHANAQKRIFNIIEYLTYLVWSYTSRSLYNQDRLMFTLLLAIKIDLARGYISMNEFQVFIKGEFMRMTMFEYRSYANFFSVQSFSIFLLIHSIASHFKTSKYFSLLTHYLFLLVSVSLVRLRRDVSIFCDLFCVFSCQKRSFMLICEHII